MSKLPAVSEDKRDPGENKTNGKYATSHDSILSCPICMDIYKTPRMLPCQHTLCDPCLRAYLINKNMSRVLVMDFPCPVCRAPTPAPKTYKPLEEWAGQFPLNHILVSLLDGRSKMILEAINKQTEIKAPSEDNRDTCPQHPEKEVDFFCVDHVLPICGRCFKNKHRHCNVNDIEDQMEFQSRYAAVISDVDNALKYLDDTMQVVANNTSELSRQHDVYSSEIQDFLGKIEAFLQSFKQEASAKLKTAHDQLRNTLQEQYDRLGRFKDAVARTEKTLKNAGTSANMVQSLKDLAKVETEMKTHFSTIRLNHEEIQTFGLEFKLCGKLEPFLESLEQLGRPKVEVAKTSANLPLLPTLSVSGTDDTLDDVFSSPRHKTDGGCSAEHEADGRKSDRQDFERRSTHPHLETEANTHDVPHNEGRETPESGPQSRSHITRAGSDAFIDYATSREENASQPQEAVTSKFTSRFSRQLSQPASIERHTEAVSPRQTQGRDACGSGGSNSRTSSSSTSDNTHVRDLRDSRSTAHESPTRAINMPRPLRDRRAVKIQDIQTHISSDLKECNITGSTSLPDAKLILVDCNNCKIKLFSKDFKAQSHLEFDREPWNVVATTPHEIAVTVPLEKAIHLVRVQGNLLTEVRRIDTRKECWGITHLDGKLVVTAKDDGSWVLFLDKTGRELMTVNFASKDNPSILRPVSITTAPSGQVMYVSCEGQSGTKGALVTMAASGEVKNVYTHWSLDKPYSSTVDREGNVYVHGMRSSNVHVVSSTGERIKILLTTQDSISRPQHIRFLPGTDTFLLTERRLDTGSIFEMK